MTVLLTGATGNIGSHLLPLLIQRGHPVRAFAGDVTDQTAVREAIDGAHTVFHLAAIIPPRSDEQPERARAVNVDGTANIVAACQKYRARLLFTSTFDVHGRTLGRTPPRRVEDPVVATDPYTEHKILGERLIRESGLCWAIFRLTDVPVLGMRAAHPIMFEIGLDNRIEALHADDAAYAIAGALETDAVWGRVLFVGGGQSCQLTYREYLARLLAAMGMKPLPDKAFSDAEYVTDWVDSSASEELLHYQRHNFDDIAAAIAASLGWRRRLLPLVAPLARAGMLRLSPYYRRR